MVDVHNDGNMICCSLSFATCLGPWQFVHIQGSNVAWHDPNLESQAKSQVGDWAVSICGIFLPLRGSKQTFPLICTYFEGLKPIRRRWQALLIILQVLHAFNRHSYAVSADDNGAHTTALESKHQHCWTLDVQLGIFHWNVTLVTRRCPPVRNRLISYLTRVTSTIAGSCPGNQLD